MSMAAGLKLSSGYDMMMSETTHNFRGLMSIGIDSVQMASNVNVSFILVLVCMVVGGILLLVDKFVSNKKKTSVEESQANQDNELIH